MKIEERVITVEEQVKELPVESVVIIFDVSDHWKRVHEVLIKTGSDGWKSLDRSATWSSEGYHENDKIAEWIDRMSLGEYEIEVVTP
jgi:hypothetical protein